jgi:DNA-directed RNA polymerase subunit RPC12/RpoP
MGWAMTFVERDKWYSVIDCKRCLRGTVLDEASAEADLASRAPAAFNWKCPYCGNRQMVQRDQVECCQGIYL